MPKKLPLAVAALIAAAGFGTGTYYLWPKGHAAASSCQLQAQVPAAAVSTDCR
ncbi:MAG TPA: hypothetical protein VGL76_10425 [Gaiellaceae bacterium]